MRDDLPPAPPADFASRDLQVEVMAAGTKLHRIHESRHGAVFFGRAMRWRFDDPAGAYGTMYAGLGNEIAFAETLLRNGASVAESELAKRSFSEILVMQDLRFAPLHGAALVAMGATAGVAAGPYPNSRAWSQAIHAHPAGVDGIIYRSNRDNAGMVVAVFDRAVSKIAVGGTAAIMDDRPLLARILDRYAAGLS